jgi:hypothetical protein
VKVVIHQTVGVQSKMKAGDDEPEDREKSVTVLMIQKNVLLGVASGSDMVEGTMKFHAQWTGHEAHSNSTEYTEQDLTPSICLAKTDKALTQRTRRHRQSFGRDRSPVNYVTHKSLR